MREATEIILNPKGNQGLDGRRWMAAQRQCLRELAPAEVSLVDSPEEAAQTARQSALKGYTKIISVGASATAHGVANGVMALAESHRQQIKVGFLSFARQDVWSRTLELPRHLARQLEILSAGHTLPYDVGRVECQHDGDRITRHFLAGASIGVTGQLQREWRDAGHSLLESLPRMAAALREAAASGSPRLRLEQRGVVLYEGPCALAMLMGGRYHPAFGQIAPQANPSDGLLDVACMDAANSVALLLKLAGMLLTPLRRKVTRMDWRHADHVRAVPLRGPLYVEADGQLVGRLPATFSVVPRALETIVAPVAVKLHKPRFARPEQVGNGRLVGNIKSAAGL